MRPCVSVRAAAIAFRHAQSRLSVEVHARRPFCAWVSPSPGGPADSGGTSPGRCGWRWTLDALVPASSVSAGQQPVPELDQVMPGFWTAF